MENLKKDRKSAILKLAQDIANVEGGIYMATFRILIDSVDKALDFNKIVDQCEFNVDLVNGRTYVDAKSLVGIFSLPLYRPLEVIAYADQASTQALEERLTEYVIERVGANGI